MKISLNWLKEYVDIKVPNDELIDLIGSRLVEVEKVIDETHKYDNVFVVKVVECEHIPDTHLSLCMIDDGGKCDSKKITRRDDGLIQVLCGAPNVHAGMMAAWIAPGAIVPQTFHDVEPFVIGVRKMLKTYDSHGMLAGADELDFSDNHDSIVELDPKIAKPGTPLAEVFDLNDVILDIENKSLTHRPDCFGIIGFAREVAGILDEEFETPEWLLDEEEIQENIKSDIKPTIEIENGVCPRYTVAILHQDQNPAKQKKYLTKIATFLSRSGMRPIDEMVDLANYMMLLTGQPLHTFDYDKFVAVGGLKKAKIIVRTAKAGEKIVLLGGEEIELTTDDILITSNNTPVGLAGAKGGENTAIDENTKNILLESATFDLYHLRKTQMAHGIFSEAITRFTKGQPAGQTLAVAKHFIGLAKPIYSGSISADEGNKTSTNIVSVSVEQVNNLLGTNYTKSEIIKTLQNVNFKIESLENTLKITVPYWRTDIEIPEDIIEEIGRIKGYDNITPVLPKHGTPILWNDFSIKTEIRNILASFGGNEVLTYNFIHGDLLDKIGQDKTNSYKLINSISPDLQYIRQSISPSLLIKARENLKAGYDDFVLFEMNQVFRKSQGLRMDAVSSGDSTPVVEPRLGIVFVNKKQSEFYQAKNYINKLTEYLDTKIIWKEFKGEKDNSEAFLEPKRSAVLYARVEKSTHITKTMEERIGVVGEIKKSVARALKVPIGSAVAELSLSALQFRSHDTIKEKKNFILNQYPKVDRDLTLSVPLNAKYGDYYEKINQRLAESGLEYSITPKSIYIPESQNEKNLSFHIELRSTKKTLTNTEIQDIMRELEDIK